MVKESSRGQKLAHATEVYNIMKPILGENNSVESLYGIFLDTGNQIIAIEKLSSGTLNSSPVYSREIVKRMLKLAAGALILVHNHPSGSLEASAEDRSVTVKIGIALASIDATLHDHLIVGDGYHSLADEGLLAEVKSRFTSLLNGYLPSSLKQSRTSNTVGF